MHTSRSLNTGTLCFNVVPAKDVMEDEQLELISSEEAALEQEVHDLNLLLQVSIAQSKHCSACRLPAVMTAT